MFRKKIHIPDQRIDWERISRGGCAKMKQGGERKDQRWGKDQQPIRRAEHPPVTKTTPTSIPATNLDRGDALTGSISENVHHVPATIHFAPQHCQSLLFFLARSSKRPMRQSFDKLTISEN